ncbi:hypothetical protein, conserved [Plasmodium gonderi]|uniref:RNA-editing substrate-binding complex 6 protein domain-containing protein n=1 Tax=Plasmodium gonderi TaxID=77519 RepID=A0A1Y1JIU3_PLAGO|nr:hypothetical protein, conserved [Plasmodium gonderi]GAW80702.1 hypothetical protein, conserved [Plasmodium gonderi]
MLKHIYLRIMITKKALRNKCPNECRTRWKIGKVEKLEFDHRVANQRIECGNMEEKTYKQLDDHLKDCNGGCLYKKWSSCLDTEADVEDLNKYKQTVKTGSAWPYICCTSVTSRVPKREDVHDGCVNMHRSRLGNGEHSRGGDKGWDKCGGKSNGEELSEMDPPNESHSEAYGEERPDELKCVLSYASSQVIKSLHLNKDYIKCKDFFMSLSLICNQLAIHQFDDKTFWNILSVKLTELLNSENIQASLCVRWLALILNSFARVQVVNRNFLRQSSIYIQSCKEEDLHTFDISQIANCFGKLNYRDENLFKHMEQLIQKKINELSYQSISNICNAYCKLNFLFPNLFFHLSKKIKKNMDKFNEQELANILNSYSKLGVKNYYDIFNRSFPFVYSKFYKFKAVEIVMITNAYAKCQIYDKLFFSYLFTYIKKNANLFEPSELAILANAYANFNLSELKVFEIIKNKLFKREHLLQPGNVAMLLHAFGKLQIREEHFIINLIMKKKNIINSLDSRNLTLFYVSLIKLNIHIPTDICTLLKRNILAKLHTFTDLALVSICYSSMSHTYFDINIVSSILILLNKRKANSKSFAHQIHVTLFVLHSLYDFFHFSLKFLHCLYNLLNRAYQHITKPSYYDINKSAIQKKIFPFFPQKYLNVQAEVPIGPFVVDFLLNRKHPHHQTPEGGGGGIGLNHRITAEKSCPHLRGRTRGQFFQF